MPRFALKTTELKITPVVHVNLARRTTLAVIAQAAIPSVNAHSVM
jgi:hypothetical protein